MPLNGKTNEEKIYNFFKSKGLNDYACAGLTGNAYAESGHKPNNLQDTYQEKLGMTDEEYTSAVDNGTYNNFIYDSAGYGIFQFTYWTLKKGLLEYARETNCSIGNLEMQLEYSWQTFKKSYSGMLNILKAAKSIKEASNAVLLKFERPADQSISVQNKRASYSQEYYDKYATSNITNENVESENIMSIKTYTKGVVIKLSTNFKSTEFDCHGSGCCSSTLIDEMLVEYIQKIRDHFGKPVNISSGYRCATHNKNIGGATKSYHSKGQAADIYINGVTPAEIAKYAESIGIKGIGLYETNSDGYFVHIDTRTTKYFWYGQAQAYRSTFGGTSNIGSASNNNAISSTSVSTSVLRYGSSGDAVKELQEKLIALGYSCGTKGADGNYGTATTNAVRKFQTDKKLSVDGVAGAETLTAIEAASVKIKITATALNVRAGAGTNYKVLTTVRKDSIHLLLEEKSGWGRISKGWISSKYYKKI